MTIKAVLLILSHCLVAGAALFIGYKLWAPAPASGNVTVQPEKRQSDGSVVVARVPIPEKSAGKPAHKIPAGHKETRRVSVTIQPAKQGECACGPVTADLSVVEGGDGSRIVTSSPDGEVTNALDVPLFDARHEYKNAIGLTWSGQPGVMYQREVARRVIVGGQAELDDDNRAEGRVFVLLRY